MKINPLLRKWVFLRFDTYRKMGDNSSHGENMRQTDPDLPWGRDDSPAVDHVHALSREGCPGDVIENVRLTHALCNIRKHDKPNEELDLPFELPRSREWKVHDKVIETM